MHTRSRKLGWPCLLLAFFVGPGQAFLASDVKRVLTEVINVNDPFVRPVKDQATTLQVNVDFHPIAFSDFDEVAQKLSGTMWLEVTWVDELLTWDPSLYNFTFFVKPDPKYVWRPNIAIINTYNEMQPVGGDFTLIVLMYSGNVTWYPGFTFEVFCKMDLRKYPFDTQTCYFEFFLWGDFPTEAQINAVRDGLNLDSYLANGEWELTTSWTEVRNLANQVATLAVRFKLRRLPSFVAITVLVPVFFLSIMNIMVFAIPIESGEKVSYAITVLLSLAVFLSFISDTMPQTSESLSALSVVIAVQLGLSSLYIILTILIMRVYHWGSDKPVTGNMTFITRLGLRMRHRKVHDVIMVQEKKVPIDGPDVAVSDVTVADGEVLTWLMAARALDNICFVIFTSVIVTMIIAYILVMILF